jgi:prolyl oligopeptidase
MIHRYTRRDRFHVALIASIAVNLGIHHATLANPMTYPATKKVDQTDVYFGTSVADPYRWLEDDNAEDTRAWVAEQNQVTAAYLDKIAFREPLLKRIRALVDYPRFSAPFSRNGSVYFYKNDGLQNQSVLYVQKGVGKPDVLIDPNMFSPDSTIRLESFELDKSGRLAAYGKTAIPGSDWREIHVMDVATKKALPDVIRWVKYSGVAWRGNGFYYSRFPETAAGHALTAKNEHQKVYYHRLGTPQSADHLVYQTPNHPSFYLDVSTSEDERFAFITVQDPAHRGNALLMRDDAKGETAFRPIAAETSTADRFSPIDNEGDRILVDTTREAPKGKIELFDPHQQPEKRWQSVVPEHQYPLESVTTAGNKLFLTYLQDVVGHAYVYSRAGQLEHEILLPGPGTVSVFGGLKADHEVFYAYTSMNYPTTIFRYEIASRTADVFRAPEIAGFKTEDYETRQVFYASKDGTRIPMFLVFRKGLQMDGNNPTILYGYGGFNITLGPSFSAARLAWLEKGGIFALANLRGGGEYGEAWHEAGMRLNKQNVFDDCIAAAQYLIEQRYTSTPFLALQGGSNGGLLVGAVINQRPDLFKVAVPEVGVMDMLRFQRFSSGTAWVSDYGSSDDETQFRYLLGYSPLQNLKAGVAYPATLVVTSDHDDRVVPAHSFKYIATLQEKSAGDAPHLIRIETNSGHGSSNLTKGLATAADVYSFIWANMGLNPTY